MSDEAYYEAVRIHCIIGPKYKCLGKYINAALNKATGNNRSAVEIATFLRDNFGMTYIPGKSFSLHGEKGILYNGINLKSNQPPISPEPQPNQLPLQGRGQRIPGVTPRRHPGITDHKQHPSFGELSQHLGLTDPRTIYFWFLDGYIQYIYRNDGTIDYAATSQQAKYFKSQDEAHE